ncbi:MULTISPECIES: phosphatase PAP2 family protein [unclassified Streptomyces]|uniref:phosphatase PAP2 family protein n=1 Tax=unclassified Streptomyces TaxID=2593676 RepID=UPI00381A3652
MRPPSTPPSPPAPPRPPGRTALLVAAVLAVLAAVVTVCVAARWGPLLSFDREVADALHRRAVAEPALTRTNRILTDWFWDPWTMRLLTAVAVVLLWLRNERRLALWVTATSVLGAAVSQGLKWAVGRERPQWPDPVDSAHFAAYPSGHAMTATVTCGLLLWLLRRRGVGPRVWRTAVVIAAVSVAGVGFTRLWLGVHWGSDVLGGWLLGGCLVALAVASYDHPALSRRR